MECALDAVFAALAGEPPVDRRMVEPPFQARAVPPLTSGKSTYGDDLPYKVDTPNFTLQWTDPAVSAARAQGIGTALEAAWERLVVEGGWPAPVSSDRYRLWVILDPELGGSGWTTEYPTDDYPDGYPVMYVNPTFIEDPTEYVLSVAVHELGHAIQYAVRDWELDAKESWYWEASAEWMAELGGQDLDTYAWSVHWYAEDPTLAWNSTANFHHYGMVLFNAWLDEYRVGQDGFRELWLDNAGGDWEALISEAGGDPVAVQVREMSGAYLAGQLRESALYREVEPEEVDLPGTFDLPGRYGTRYLRFVHLGQELVVEGPVEATFVDGTLWTDTPQSGEEVLAAVTWNGEPGETFSLSWREREEPPEVAACGCSAGGTRPWPGVFGLLALSRWRRSPVPRGGRRSPPPGRRG